MVDSGHLESLGKVAAQLSESTGISMTQAVVQTIGMEKLNAEHVRRVVEFANVEAYNRKFASLTGHLRTVHFDSGPADPVQVLQSLNCQARPQEVTIEALEYTLPPDFSKRASVSAFVPSDRTRRGVLNDVYALHSKLSAAHDELVQNAEAAKERMNEHFAALEEQVKSASAGGAHPGEIFHAWARVHPELAKVAYQQTAAFMRPQNEKVAGRELNPAARLVTEFRAFVKEAQSYETYVRAVAATEAEMRTVSNWFSQHGE
jgi:hypothetical protein